MTGFIKGLFKGVKDKVENQDPNAPSFGVVLNSVKKSVFNKKQSQAAPPKADDTFFLEPDDAKTFGNIDYMREVKTIEHTFPNGKRKNQVRQISANSYRNLDNQSFSSGPSFATASAPKAAAASKTSFAASKPSFAASKPSFSKPKVKETENRGSSSDTSMDMFRNMAKSIRKG